MGNFVFINSLLNFLLNWCDGLWALALPNHPCGNPWCRQWSPYHPASRYLSTARKWCWRPMWSCCGRWPLLRACKMKSISKTPKTSRRNQSNLLSNNRFKIWIKFDAHPCQCTSQMIWKLCWLAFWKSQSETIRTLTDSVEPEKRNKIVVSASRSGK